MKKQKNPHRAARLSAQIRRDLSQLIARELKDPRVLWVSLTEVQLTADYAHAKVFFSSLNAQNSAEIAHALNHSAAFLRSLLGKNWHAHTLPQLHFVYDDSVLKGEKMEHLIQQALSKTAADS